MNSLYSIDEFQGTTGRYPILDYIDDLVSTTSNNLIYNDIYNSNQLILYVNRTSNQLIGYCNSNFAFVNSNIALTSNTLIAYVVTTSNSIINAIKKIT